MTEPTVSSAATPPTKDSAQLLRRRSGARRDAHGRAYAGSQMCLQVMVNRRPAELASHILRTLGSEGAAVHLEWISPLETKRFAEWRDGAFLRALKLERHRQALAAFWPKGGPVWDGLARIVRDDGTRSSYLLLEAKSYPDEVRGGGCKATKDSAARRLIEASLDTTARWLGLSTKPESWMGELYQSANRVAHVYFLREQLGLDAFMVNVCFVGDARISTTEADWKKASRQFRRDLLIDDVSAPWLVDVYPQAPSRSELVPANDGGP